MKRSPCPNCNWNEWNQLPITKLINPNGEFVEGFGHVNYYTIVGYDFQCVSCGYIVGRNPTIVDIYGNVVGKINV